MTGPRDAEMKQNNLKYFEIIFELGKTQENNVFNTYSPLWNTFLSERGKFAPQALSNMLATNQSSGTTGFTTDPELYLAFYDELISTKTLDKYPLSPIGRPPTFDFKGHPIAVSYLDRLAIFALLEEWNAIDEPIDILEIGAGFGLFSYFFMKSGKVRSYTIVDLPENLVNSAFYLSENFPDLAIGFGEKQTGLNLIPPGHINRIDAFRFDLAINTDSLGEMLTETAQAYVLFIHEHLREGGRFFSKNGHRRGRAHGVQKVSQYGYSRFALTALRPSINASSAYDDFSHLILLEKQATGMSETQTRYLDTLSDCYSLGFHEDLIELSARLPSDTLTAEDVRFLDWAIAYFAKREGSYSGPYQACARGMTGIRAGVNGLNNSSDLQFYIQHGKSWAARGYCYFLLHRGELSEKDFASEHHNHLTKDLCDAPGTSRALRWAIRRIQLDKIRKKVDLNWRPSLMRRAKDFVFNLKEGRLAFSR